ncbi:MAG TPA: hypothetical protein VI854_09160 [Acidimicrobiia bacterium]|nr:hypothetical protein [Acidimicrobiia bacterium]
MIRTIRTLALGGAVIAAAVVLSPVAAPAGDASPSPGIQAAESSAASSVEVISVNSRGTANNESKDSNRTVYTFPMYSLATGEEIGTITDDVGLTPVPGVVDVIATFRFADGEIVNHMPVSISQDSQKPGWIVVGNRPEGNTISKATGAYEGRTGKVRLSGVDDVNRFPATIFQDDFWIIELDR